MVLRSMLKGLSVILIYEIHSYLHQSILLVICDQQDLTNIPCNNFLRKVKVMILQAIVSFPIIVLAGEIYYYV